MRYKFYFLVLIIAFSLVVSLSSLIIAQEKNINVNVRVVANDSIVNSGNNALESNPTSSAINSNSENINESLTTKEFGSNSNNGVSELLSVKNNSSWFIPIGLIAIAVVIIIASGFFKRKKRIRKTKRKRHKR